MGAYYPNFTVMDFAVVQSKIRTVIITVIKKLSVELIEEIQTNHTPLTETMHVGHLSMLNI